MDIEILIQDAVEKALEKEIKKYLKDNNDLIENRLKELFNEGELDEWIADIIWQSEEIKEIVTQKFIDKILPKIGVIK